MMSGQKTRHRRPLTLALLAALILGLALVIWQSADIARERALTTLQRDAQTELRLSATGLTGYLSRHEYLPELLATRETVKRYLSAPDDQNAMPLNRLFNRFRSTTGVSDIYLLDAEGTTLAASNWHREDTFIGENYRFRPYYQDAIAGHYGRFHGLGVVSMDRGYYFSAPVWLDDTAPDATPAGVMVVKIRVDALEASWQGPNSSLLVVDQNGVVFMSSQPELRLTSLDPLSPERLDQLRSSRRYADEPLTASHLFTHDQLDQGARLVGFTQGPLADQRYLSVTRDFATLGWQMHILKPMGPVNDAQWQAMLMGGGLYGLLALACGVGWQRHRLRREREAFAERERTTLAKARDELERNVASRTQDLVASNQRLSAEIDERRRTEATLRQTRDELIQAAKLAVLGQLAAGINHELNQPLAAIRAYAENARGFLARERLDTVDTNLGEIIELTGRMADISAQLRQFSRKSGEPPSPVSTRACIDYALRLFKTRLDEQHVDVVFDLPDEAPWVLADLVRLEQVLVNLIGNALQAMAHVAEPKLVLGVAATEDSITIRVDDNGPGIPEPQRRQVFEPFYTTKAPGAGLGLGLSISARIIDDLGGRLAASVSPLGGARFTIDLPRAASTPAPGSMPYQEKPPHV
nr:ATP-binding protein [Halomonas denitrificans]